MKVKLNNVNFSVEVEGVELDIENSGVEQAKVKAEANARTLDVLVYQFADFFRGYLSQKSQPNEPVVDTPAPPKRKRNRK
jgi:hypothetical protein